MWIVAAVLAGSMATVCAATAGPGDTPLDQSNSWAFNPAPDKFTPDALLDLRSLNEKVAGEKGFLRLSEDGNSFVLGDGTPVRFWALDSDAELKQADLERHCRFLAKLGVNMARIGFTVCDNKDGAPITAVDDKAIDNAMRFVATAKKYGIYTLITPFWANTPAPASWGLEGVAKQSVWGLMFFNQKLQDAYKTWVKELYTRPNPYDGGLPLSQEPAVGIIQIQNEDGMFFWTMQGLPELQRRILEKQFGDWLLKKYGSLDAAKAAWNGFSQPGDDFGAGIVAMINEQAMTWEMIQPRQDGAATRMRDEVEFIARLQHAFYADMEDYYRNQLGCRQLINACNWKSADPVLLEDLERWTYTANEVIALNRYCGVIHEGPNNGYRIDPGHLFANQPVVLDPLSFPGADKQIVGHPFIITETAWVRPARYQSAAPFLAAVYSSLTGVDTFFWFAVRGDATWQLDPRKMWWHVSDADAGYAIDKWTCSVPQDMGMWPANALAFRMGYVEPASEPVVHEERSLSDMWDRTVPIISEEGKYDPNRDKGQFAPASPIKQQVDPLAFMVGPVEVKYDGDPARTRVADLTPYIDRANGIVRSVTGQIGLNYKLGVCAVNAPRYQGVAGFLKSGGGHYILSDVSIASSNEYAAVSVVPLDGQPLAASRRVLVQVGTVVRPTDWRVEPATFKANDQDIDGYRIVTTGKPPLRVANTEVTLTIANPALSKATLLDVGGYASRQVPVQAAGGTLTVQLPPDTMYLVLG
jgi:hypothetical protein